MSYIVPFQTIGLFENTFRHQINKKTGKIDDREFVFNRHFGPGDNDLAIESDRYRIIWMPGCPHSNKAVITARLLGLDRVISIGECGILRDPRGWVFSEDLGEVDPVLKIHYLDDAYLKGDPDFTGRSTVPAIVDIKTGAVVQNEAWDIPKYLIVDWKRYHKENSPDLYPVSLRKEIDETIEFIKTKVNAYACGFALNQEQYDRGYEMFHNALDELEERLLDKRFLHGDYITLSDIHLYVALIRFYINYHLVFGVNKKRLQEYPNLWGYTRELFKTDAFYEFTKLDEIKKHYQLSPHMRAKQGNVFGLVGTGPDLRELFEATDRKKLSNDEDNLYIYEQNTGFYGEYYLHKDVKIEIKYLNKFVLEPIKKASESTFQTDLNRWNANLIDALKQIDKRLDKSKYLLSDEISDADILLYKTLKKLDYIYYHLLKLNSYKSYDFSNIKRFEEDYISEKGDNLADIIEEKEKEYSKLDEIRNPYGIIFRGPEI